MTWIKEKRECVLKECEAYTAKNITEKKVYQDYDICKEAC